ncbi:MAG: hypothetical protein GX567_05940 [Clostridia bacterium]|nr:hypothetical protein [Clostridia bacterium]
MPQLKTIGIIGGDKRHYYLTKLMVEQGFKVFIYNVVESKDLLGERICRTKSLRELMESASIIICPFPFCIGTDIKVFCSYITKKHTLIGGGFPSCVISRMRETDAEFYDYTEHEDFLTENARSTAEGAIAEVIIKDEGRIYGSKCVIFGYGKCAKALAQSLSGLQAKIYIAARNIHQLKEAFDCGYESFYLYDVLENRCDRENPIVTADYIFNTVPILLLDQRALQYVSKDAFIMDIASKPGGTDFHTCQELQIRAELSLGIPGKYAPKASAKLILRSIRDLIG